MMWISSPSTVVPRQCGHVGWSAVKHGRLSRQKLSIFRKKSESFFPGIYTNTEHPQDMAAAARGEDDVTPPRGGAAMRALAVNNCGRSSFVIRSLLISHHFLANLQSPSTSTTIIHLQMMVVESVLKPSLDLQQGLQ